MVRSPTVSLNVLDAIFWRTQTLFTKKNSTHQLSEQFSFYIFSFSNVVFSKELYSISIQFISVNIT